jgi:exopolysaccharide production protein ExoQ
MPPKIATLVFAIGVSGLFRLNRDESVKTSKALWLPALWLAIGASRMPTQWFQAFLSGSAGGPGVASADQLAEGSLVDRLFISFLVFLALGILVARLKPVNALITKNFPLILFFFYCAVSVIWSDYPLVAFKRWIKDLGDLSMVLIVLSDANPAAAIQRLFSRVGFVLVPASVLVIKYFPGIGRGYHPWSWNVFYVGVAGGKNELGMLCLIFGVASVWRIVRIYRGDEGEHRFRRLLAHGVVFAMVCWLLSLANSATSLSCLMMASVLIIVTSFRALDRKPFLAHVLVASMLCVSFSALFLNLGSGLVETLGRDSSLTGRTTVWKLVLGMAGNPIIGTGFESFWLGERLSRMWAIYWWHPNEAHDGYLEVYLTLGWIGVALLFVVLVTGYKNAITSYRHDLITGRFKLACLLMAVAYNFTESAIRVMNPMWFVFLFAVMNASESPVPESPPQHNNQPVALPRSELRMNPVYRTASRRGTI